jgi:hypothetical protein
MGEAACPGQEPQVIVEKEMPWAKAAGFSAIHVWK